MATMFYQQLINRKTVSPHDGPFQIPLLPSGGENMTISAVQMQPGKNEKEREREKGVTTSHTFREESLSHRALQPGKEKYTGPLCIRVECAEV